MFSNLNLFLLPFFSRTTAVFFCTRPRSHVRISLLQKSTAMSANPNTVVPENGLNDCTAQPPKDDAAAAAAACSEQPSLNGVARASSPSNVDSVVSSENGDHVSAAASSIAPSSMDETVPVDVPDVEIAGPSSSR